MHARFLSFALAAGALGACSLFTDLSGFSNGPADAAAGAEASTTDASAEATSGDAGATDGGDTDADASTPFCLSGAHAFCKDFDEGTLADWTGNDVDALGKIELSTAHAVSPPAAFHAVLARRAAGDLEYALLAQDFVGPWRRTVIDFEMLLDPPAWLAGDINASYIQLGFADVNGRQDTVYFPIGDGYAEITAKMVDIALDPIPTGVFFHVHLDVDPGKAIAVVIAGKAYSQAMSPLTGPGTKTTLDLGVTGYNAPVPAFSVYYDDVVVDFPP